jgi:hypothetical protein
MIPIVLSISHLIVEHSYLLSVQYLDVSISKVRQLLVIKVPVIVLEQSKAFAYTQTHLNRLLFIIILLITLLNIEFISILYLLHLLILYLQLLYPTMATIQTSVQSLYLSIRHSIDFYVCIIVVVHGWAIEEHPGTGES